MPVAEPPPPEELPPRRRRARRHSRARPVAAAAAPPPRPPEHKPPPPPRPVVAEAPARPASPVSRPLHADAASARVRYRCRARRVPAAASSAPDRRSVRRSAWRAARSAAAAAADAGQRIAVGDQWWRRLGHERRAVRPIPRRAARRPASRRRARRRRAAHGNGARHRSRTCSAAARWRRRATASSIPRSAFGLLFLAVIAKLADATILQPLAPHRPETADRRLCSPRRRLRLRRPRSRSAR